VPFIWGKNQQESYSALKKAVVIGPVLRIVDPQKPFFLETDASGIAVRGVLLQEGRPVAFESKKLSPSQRNSPTHERVVRCCACIESMEALFIWCRVLRGRGPRYVEVLLEIA